MVAKEEEIIKKIEEITGKKPIIESDFISDTTQDIRPTHIDSILFFSSSYDFFLLEEEGRLYRLFQSYYADLLNLHPPSITHAETETDCFKSLEAKKYDVIIVFNKLSSKTFDKFTKTIKKENPSIPVVFINNDIKELQQIQAADKEKTIDYFFTWNGDGKILPALIHLIDDTENIKNNIQKQNARIILLVEDSIEFYSKYIGLIDEAIQSYLDVIIQPELHRIQKTRRFLERPYIIHTSDFQHAKQLYNSYKNNIIALITDNHEQKEDMRRIEAGVDLAKTISKEKPHMPILIQSSEPSVTDKTISKNVQFMLKTTPNLRQHISDFVLQSIGSTSLVVPKSGSKQSDVITSIASFQQQLISIPPKTLFALSRNHQISQWLKTLGEFELSHKIYQNEQTAKQEKEFHKNLIDIFEEYTYSLNQLAITLFDHKKQDPQSKINRIGEGSLGGKGRGLAFFAKLFSKYISDDLFPELKITIPRTIVVSTDIFDEFIKRNNILPSDLINRSDERIAATFINANLPPTVLGDLRSFVRNTRKPLIIRSSGMLEDSLLQPFAGIYASMLLPNESWETDLRFQEVCNAIKYVFSSTYFEKARTYLKSTPKHISDEKMAVIIQEVVGQKHQHFFYPAISGVAKSYNHYPSGPCTPKEGIVYLALGLGKAIVDGGSSYCFCPYRAKTPLCGTPKDFMRYAQTSFYAINLQSVYSSVKKNEETSISKLDIATAKQHGILDQLVSTYSMRDDQLWPGLEEDGALIVNFAPIIEYDSLPLAKALQLLLSICEITLGYPVEIEFAVNIYDKEDEPAELVVLQVRNMIPPGTECHVDLKEYQKNNIICYSTNALGNGVISDIYDIVYVKPETFDMANSQRIADQIREINLPLLNEKKPYLLIGPGRWGSSDSWLGIPVNWSDIAGAKIIVETPVEGKSIEPSQGSHFFHDMIASQVGYLITEKKEEMIQWDYLKSLKVINETDDVKHVKSQTPLETRLDGIHRKAVILKTNKNKSKSCSAGKST